MLFSTLVFTLFLASTAFAAPNGQVRRTRQSNPLRRIKTTDISDALATSHVTYSHNWAGAVWNTYPTGSFREVTGTFIVPTPGPPDGDASIWVGIDGDTCTTAILQTGIDLKIQNGVVSYDAWYEWYPDQAYLFGNISIESRDVIKLNVTAFSQTTGIAAIENLSNGQAVYQNLDYPLSPLCEENAEWIVEDFSVDNALVPFCDFETVTFTDAYAYLNNGSYVTPNGATEIVIVKDDKVLTSVEESFAAVTITYLS